MSSEQGYSLLDRLIHRLALPARGMQFTAADMENALYGKAFRGVQVERPIFITSLPRAGTTLLLEMLNRVPGHASHCYRDMPFVLAPFLWAALSKGFRKSAVSRERAHGDGMQISYDSPEALEEVVWGAFWPEHFESDRILLWSGDEKHPEFEEFFVDHMRKIIALRAGGTGRQGRYVSKNNANIARVALLRRLFPDSAIVIPFRDPVDHAGSLHRQHLRFLEVHAREAFSKRYMADIGHFEFGELHRPIDFSGLDNIRGQHPPASLDYWLGYWVAAFGEILRSANDVVFVSYERLCHRGAPALREVERSLGLERERLVEAAAGSLRAPRTYDIRSAIEDRDLVDRAEALHDRLLEVSIV